MFIVNRRANWDNRDYRDYCDHRVLQKRRLRLRMSIGLALMACMALVVSLGTSVSI
ncbi:MAG: hypothetical protein ABIQ90_05540 [Polaromonas sp.]